MSDKLLEPEKTYARSWEELKLKQDFNAQTWGFGSMDRWDADLDLGTIKFSNADGFTVTGDVQIIGSYDTIGQTWLWAWTNPSVPPRLAHAAQAVRAFGEKHDILRYSEEHFSCSEDDAWRFTALGQFLTQAAGAYRGSEGATDVYMTFDNLIIVKADVAGFAGQRVGRA
ncbi:DUF6882 domain-containing protein [Phenylobacterium sp.]|uniref:DUF6882 domain-containing protein n=1 Tax=Phenylobacterium sp. TaxID=1871053 RepID=UPI00286AEDB3|nr:DUF6882 domain-containing protein [Phenylobacterium sp.]